MADVKWIKITTDIFDNRKIRQIESLPDGDAIIVLWIKMLCLAGSVNDSGAIYLTPEVPYTDQMLATYFNRPLATIQLALQIFQQFGMIEVVDDVISISNWQKYQNYEKLDEIKEQNRLRQAKRRAKLQLQECNEGMSRDSNVTVTLPVTQCNAIDKDIDKEKDKDIDKSNKSNKRMTRPTLEEVKEYCSERGNNVDAQRFIDYYESNGWKVGKNPMKDWKAAVRTWERSTAPAKDKPSNGVHVQRDYDAIMAAAKERAARIGKGG